MMSPQDAFELIRAGSDKATIVLQGFSMQCGTNRVLVLENGRFILQWKTQDGHRVDMIIEGGRAFVQIQKEAS